MLATGSMLTARQLAAPGDLLPSSRRASSGWQRRQRSRARQLAPAAAATVEPEDKKDAPEETKTATKPAVRLVSASSAKEQAAKEKIPISGFGELMGFKGAAPEIINGRLAMLGFSAALGAELRGGGTVFAQLDSAPTAVLLVSTLIALGSLVPLAKGSAGNVVGPFTPNVEMWNGRFAMLGVLIMLIVEGVSGVKAF